jgi:hypothetical protein
MKILIISLILFLIPLVCAETTFFDNPDDIFVMANPAAANAVNAGGTTEETATFGSCTYKWNCTDWDRCSFSGKQNRICSNIGTCSEKYKPPRIEQNCTYLPITGETIWREIIHNNKIIAYLVFIIIILLITIYFEKKYLKKQIKKHHRKVL